MIKQILNIKKTDVSINEFNIITEFFKNKFYKENFEEYSNKIYDFNINVISADKFIESKKIEVSDKEFIIIKNTILNKF